MRPLRSNENIKKCVIPGVVALAVGTYLIKKKLNDLHIIMIAGNQVLS